MGAEDGVSLYWQKNHKQVQPFKLQMQEVNLIDQNSTHPSIFSAHFISLFISLARQNLAFSITLMNQVVIVFPLG